MAVDRFSFLRGGTVLSGLRGGGGGDLIVLLHGLAGSAAEMVPLGEALGMRFVALDQRGHGFSARRPSDLSRQAFVDDVVALLGDEPAWLVGQSMGAHTAMLVAAEKPVRGLVMISGGVGGSTDDYPKALGEYFASWPVPFADEEAARGFLGDRPIAEAWVVGFERRPDGLYPRFDADVMEAVMRPVADAARWDAWERITAPTLLIRGADDDFDPVEAERMAGRAKTETAERMAGRAKTETAERMAGRAKTETATIAGAGHDVHLEKRDRTAQLIRRFIGGC
ncbi:alpha/beta fold hydrolase [Actinoplanes sp. NPDC051343]|uniref:alpha/beta fold hydrolase n=1 Tax=Actinoplanes sp. NPDC051343 TaxID=3363906 RepID=UPI0037A3FFD9